MRKAIHLSWLLLLFLCLPAVADTTSPSDFFTVEEYKALHPEEAKRMRLFEQQVRGPSTPLKTRQTKPVKIAVVYPGDQASDYWRRSVSSFTVRMDEIGIKYEVKKHFSHLPDYRAQAQQVREALATDPDYLVFTLDIGKHKQIIDRILLKQRPKLILQNITTPLKTWEGRQPFMYVGFDHTTGANLLAEYYRQRMGDSANYAVLFLSKGYVSSMRGDAFIRNKSALGNTLLDAYYTDNDSETAMKATKHLLTSNQVDYIYACSTDTALGGAKAIRDLGLTGKVLINGWGGGDAELEAISKGELDVTVMRMNDDNGVAMAEAIRADLEGNPDSKPLIYSGDFALVEKGIRQDELDALIKRAFRYSGIPGNGP